MPRYTLTIPDDLYDELMKLGERNNKTLKESLQMCIKSGLLLMRMAEQENADLVLRERQADGTDKETFVKLIW